MKTNFTSIIFAVATISLVSFFSSCSKPGRAVINATVEGVSNKPIVLSHLNIDKLVPIDTINTDKNGDVKFVVELPYESPDFYYLSYNGTNIASLLLSPKDKIKVKVDSLGNNLQIKGSDEAILYQQINNNIKIAQKRFDSLAVQLIACKQIGDSDGAKRIRYELGRLYAKEKQNSIVSIVNNPYSFTNITLLYRQFTENLPLFAELTDGIYFMQVADSLKRLFPNSPYVKLIEKEAVNFTNSMELREKINTASEVSFPEITMTDVNAESQSLSSLQGRPFILLFWDAEQTAQKMLSAELESIYKKYSGKKLEIFSVCITTDKSYWAQIVKRLPWINVCDGKGTSSPVLSSYNISQLPTMFIFDRNGEIVGKDIYDMNNLDALISRL